MIDMGTAAVAPDDTATAQGHPLPWHDANRRHPLLIAYDKLPEHEKDKDRDAVENFPAMVEKALFRIVWLKN